MSFSKIHHWKMTMTKIKFSWLRGEFPDFSRLREFFTKRRLCQAQCQRCCRLLDGFWQILNHSLKLRKQLVSKLVIIQLNDNYLEKIKCVYLLLLMVNFSDTNICIGRPFECRFEATTLSLRMGAMPNSRFFADCPTFKYWFLVILITKCGRLFIRAPKV